MDISPACEHGLTVCSLVPHRLLDIVPMLYLLGTRLDRLINVGAEALTRFSLFAQSDALWPVRATIFSLSEVHYICKSVTKIGASEMKVRKMTFYGIGCLLIMTVPAAIADNYVTRFSDSFYEPTAESKDMARKFHS